MPNKGHFEIPQPPAIVHYGANKNIGSNKNPSVTRGGTVLAHAPDLQLLGYAEQAADGQLLGVTAWPGDEIPGWAAATNAMNLATGERGPAVPDEIATDTKKAAKLYGAEAERKVANGIDFDPKPDAVTFRDVAEHWLSDRRDELSLAPSTATATRSARPRTLGGAIEALDEDKAISGAFPPELYRAFRGSKQSEWARSCGAVTDWQHAAYFDYLT